MGKQQQTSGDKPRPNSDDETDDEQCQPLPPDGGWGWLVVAASFLTNLIVDGVCYTFGVIMPDLLAYFESSNGKTALVGAMVPGMYLIVGPIVSALANAFGCRTVATIGSVIAGVFFALSQWSGNIDVMIFTYGVMGGIGFGFMYLPSIVMVGLYFDKKRAMATGIAVCGSGIGTFVFAPLASYLVKEYTWRGANIIIGAIIFNGIACAMLYLPLKPTRRKPKQQDSQPESAIFQNIIATKNRNRTTSTGSMDGAVITRDNELISESTALNVTVQDPVTPRRAMGSSTTSLGQSRSRLDSQVASPLARQDIFYAGSVTNLDEYKASPDMQTYVQSHTDFPPAGEESSCCGSFKNIVFKMFDFSLLMSPTFMIICLAGVLAFVGLYTPFVYVYKKALDLGTPPSTASLIISMLGVFNTAGRLASGWLADRPWADSLVIHNVSAILAGIGTCFVPALNSFGLLICYACWFGTFIAAFIALRSIVIVDLLGIQKLTNAFGLTSLFQGIACLIGSPMSGAILESTNSYVGPFVVSGLLIAAGGFLCLPARRVAAWEAARNAKRQYRTVQRTV